MKTGRSAVLGLGLSGVLALLALAITPPSSAVALSDAREAAFATALAEATHTITLPTQVAGIGESKSTAAVGTAELNTYTGGPPVTGAGITTRAWDYTCNVAGGGSTASSENSPARLTGSNEDFLRNNLVYNLTGDDAPHSTCCASSTGDLEGPSNTWYSYFYCASFISPPQTEYVAAEHAIVAATTPNLEIENATCTT